MVGIQLLRYMLCIQGARDLLADVNYFGTVMVLMGDADGMVSGAVHTTASTIRPGLQVLQPSWLPRNNTITCIWPMAAPVTVSSDLLSLRANPLWQPDHAASGHICEL